MLVDCNTCPGRNIACDDCMMTGVLGPVGDPSSKNSEVRCDEFVIDDAANIEAASALFSAAGMLSKSDTHDHVRRVNAGKAPLVPEEGVHLLAMLGHTP